MTEQLDDLSTIRSSARVVLILRPDGSPTGLEWELEALDSDAAKVVTRRITNQRNKLAARGKVFNADEIEANELDLLLAVSKSWKWGGNAGWKGEKPVFNRKNVTDVLTNAHIKGQLIEALDDTGSFFQK